MLFSCNLIAIVQEIKEGRGGGIGRRAGLRIQWGSRAGSSPALGTKFC